MTTVLQLKSVNHAGQPLLHYLHLSGEHRLPTVLGTGRNAVVLLATTTPEEEGPATFYHAVKFLRDDPDKQYAAAAADRFFQEAGHVQSFSVYHGAFVRYIGWGSIDDPGRGKEWWNINFARHNPMIVNDDPEFERLRKHFDLQGPFYILDLCQGTLHDLLDKSMHWSKLPAYSIRTFAVSLRAESSKIARDIEEVVKRYCKPPTIAGLSGYEILNSFLTDDTPDGRVACAIRNFAVLELFAEIADTVAKLHARSEAESGDPLTHRDLKPGNIFFQHTADEHGLDQIKLRLSDLGYVANPAMIARGEGTLVAGKKGAEYLALGSQFYRAPEQAELPIEVRVDVDRNDSRRVSIKGSKITRIDPHDWLTLSDLFSDDTRDPEYSSTFKILRIEYDHGENKYTLELDRPISSTRNGDLQGQITRGTGFQTDGFSLGAILYDLVSGGRNPELFYTYCLASYTSQYAYDAVYSVDDIIEILSPLPSDNAKGRSESDRLTMAEKTRATQQVWSAHSLDDALRAIQEAVLVPRNRRDSAAPERLQEQLKNFRFRSFQLVRDLLTDRRGKPIPRDILAIIVRCMVRDVEGSFYRRDPNMGYLTKDNYLAATEIQRKTAELLRREEFQWPRDDFPRSLQSNLLFKLRSLTPRVTNE